MIAQFREHAVGRYEISFEQVLAVVRASASRLRLHSPLTVCTGCNPCRPSDADVNAVFGKPSQAISVTRATARHLRKCSRRL